MAAHRYWRVYITTANAAYVGASEVELRTTLGGGTVTAGGTASASTYYAPEGLTPAKAFDGDPSTDWASDGSALPQWLKYDLGAGNAKDIVQLAWRSRPAAPTQSPKDFELQWSDDDSSWTTAISATNQTSWGSGETRDFPASDPAENSRWRINITAVDGGAVAAIVEAQFRSTPGGTNLSTPASGGYASNSAFGAATNAFDGNTSTFWAANSTTAWLAYKFTSPASPQELAITARTLGDQAQAPKNFTVERWDGTAWAVVLTVTNSTGWTAGQTRTFSLVSGTALTGVSGTGGRGSPGYALALPLTGTAAGGAVGTLSLPAAGITTAQAQTADAAGAVSIAADVATAQAQTADAAGFVGVGGAISTEQAQTADAAGDVVSAWSLLQHTRKWEETYIGPSYTTTDAITVAAGSVLAVLVEFDNYYVGSAATVTSSQGDIFTRITPPTQAGTPDNSATQIEWHICTGAAGGSTAVTATYSVACYVRHVYLLELQKPHAAWAASVQSYVSDDGTVDGLNSVTSSAFSATGNCMVLAGETNYGFETTADGGTFDSGFTTLPRQGGVGASGRSASAAGYRAAPSGLASSTVTFDITGTNPTYRGINVLVLTAAALIPTDGTVATEQAQTVSATSATEDVTYAALSGVEGTGATASLAVERERALSGAPGASATLGSIGYGRTLALVGAEAGGAVGYLALRTAATGVGGAGAVGPLQAARELGMAGVQAGAQLPPLVATVIYLPISGVQALGVTGTVAPPSGMTGVRATVGVGTITPAITNALSGSMAQATSGSLELHRRADLAGAGATAAAGNLPVQRQTAVAGVAAAATAAFVAPMHGAQGVAADAAAGVVGAERMLALAGVTAATAVGRMRVQALDARAGGEPVTVSHPARPVQVGRPAAAVSATTPAEQVMVSIGPEVV